MSILIVFPSGQWVGDIERLCAFEPYSQLGRGGGGGGGVQFAIELDNGVSQGHQIIVNS